MKQGNRQKLLSSFLGSSRDKRWQRTKQIKTTQDRIIVPQSKESVRRWKEYDLLNLPEKFKNVDKLSTKHDQTHNKIDSLEEKIERLTVRAICSEEKDKVTYKKINERIDFFQKRLKIFQWTSCFVAGVSLLIYTKVILIDHENLAKLIAIFFA